MNRMRILLAQAEINNGRLAMLGLFAFFCEARVPGSVPGLEGARGPP